MLVLSAKEVREADAYTISNEPVASIDLMERAAMACVQWITSRFTRETKFKIFCGTGNNGGDGLAIARMLAAQQYSPEVFIVRYSSNSSADFITNELLLKNVPEVSVKNIYQPEDIPSFDDDYCIIDAIFGTGLTRPVDDLVVGVIQLINSLSQAVLAIDMPSGLFADRHTESTNVVNAWHTLTFEFPKLAFFFSENEKRVGEWHVVSIQLMLPPAMKRKRWYITDISEHLHRRTKFSHKGTYGHALIIAGGYGKMGAAVLAAKACVRAGAGLTTVHVPKCGYKIIQSSVPEAMATIDEDEKLFSLLITKEQLQGITALGIGPGIGTSPATMKALVHLLKSVTVPVVLDADALNIIAAHKLMEILPPNSILTPHPKEFARLAGESANDFERHERQLEFSVKHKVFVVLKGAHTCLSTPEGHALFNSTGNPGMAKGGSGDVLTGIIASLLAQHYPPHLAAEIGVFLHGLAGDIALEKTSIESITTRDIIYSLPKAFRSSHPK